VPASAPATTDGTTTETIAAPLVRAGADPLRIPAPAPLPDTAVTPFDADPISPVEQWEPPAPRPAFDPLTAPLDEVRSQS
jgi:hypothetical protein